MSNKGPSTPRLPTSRSGMDHRRESSTPEPTSSIAGKPFQRSHSVRLRSEAQAAIRSAQLRRQLTDEEMKGRSGGLKHGRSMTSLSATCRSIPPSPAVNRKLSRDPSWETQSVIGSGDDFSTDVIARNGTTFSARCNKYVLHCAKRVDDEHYLTPTQRSTRDLRRLRMLLDQAHQTIRQKDMEIARLKHDLMTQRFRDEPDQLNMSMSSDAAPQSSDGELAVTSPADLDRAASDAEPLPSVGDSGNYECLTSPSVSSKESVDKPAAVELEERYGEDWEASERWIEWEEKQLRQQHERQLTETSQQHAADYQEMKEKYNDKVEALLQKLTESNNRYFDLRPLYDSACLRVRQLELELEAGRRRQSEVSGGGDDDSDPTVQGHHQAAALSQQLDSTRLELDNIRACCGYDSGSVRTACAGQRPRAFNRAADLWVLGVRALQKGLYEQQLAALKDESGQEMEPTMRLQFLRSAVFHLLTDRDIYPGHLTAIAAVLRFSDEETQLVERTRRQRHGAAV